MSLPPLIGYEQMLHSFIIFNIWRTEIAMIRISDRKAPLRVHGSRGTVDHSCDEHFIPRIQRPWLGLLRRNSCVTVIVACLVCCHCMVTSTSVYKIKRGQRSLLTLSSDTFRIFSPFTHFQSGESLCYLRLLLFKWFILLLYILITHFDCLHNMFNLKCLWMLSYGDHNSLPKFSFS